MAKPVKDPLTGAETTGHIWDDSLQEFDNPLPRWWVWTFYATVIFAVVYWVLYPAWPIAKGYTKGFNTVTYQTDAGEEKTTHWNMRAVLQNEMQTGREAVKQKEYLSKVGAASYDQIAQDPDMAAFVRSYGKGIFGDYCAACHQAGGQGVPGLFPNLVDDAWLWGGSTAQLEHTVMQGRNGYMPAYRETFNEEQLNQVANYVLSLSGLEADQDAAAQGQKIFNGHEGGCYQCHTAEGKGMYAQGAANLTDKIWTVSTVEGTAQANLEAVKSIIHDGVQREMPGWSSRLDETEIKVLVAYLKQLSGQE